MQQNDRQVLQGRRVTQHCHAKGFHVSKIKSPYCHTFGLSVGLSTDPSVGPLVLWYFAFGLSAGPLISPLVGPLVLSTFAFGLSVGPLIGPSVGPLVL